MREKPNSLQKHRRNMLHANPEQPPSLVRHPHTHVPCVDEGSGLELASLDIFEPTTSSFQSEAMVIFDFRRMNNNKIDIEIHVYTIN